MTDRPTLFSHQDTPCATHRHRLPRSTQCASQAPFIPPTGSPGEAPLLVPPVAWKHIFCILDGLSQLIHLALSLSARDSLSTQPPLLANTIVIHTDGWPAFALLLFSCLFFFGETYRLAIGDAGNGAFGRESEFFFCP